MSNNMAGMSDGTINRFGSSAPGSSPPAQHAEPRNASTDVLSRQRFLERLQHEKRRADRSKAPLSLVIMKFGSGGNFDVNDVRDIVTELSLSTRETDVVGYLGDGKVAFLLPYSESKAAETFSRLIVNRIDTPAVTVDFATYTEPRFEPLLNDALEIEESAPVLLYRTNQKSALALAIKRGMDVLGAIVLLAICAPLMIATAVAVKMSSPGPIIFRQTRVGRGGVPFQFYKFRSMRTDGDDRVHREYVAKLIAGQHQEINQGDAENPVYKLKADPRITGVGRLIRKTSIDELPQLFNVLKGEMSLVGPRPPITYEAEKYQSWHMRRLQEVRPGMTGLWQVEGRSKTSFDDMVRLDLRYIRNWSLWLDIKILFKTIFVVVRTDGAD